MGTRERIAISRFASLPCPRVRVVAARMCASSEIGRSLSSLGTTALSQTLPFWLVEGRTPRPGLAHRRQNCPLSKPFSYIAAICHAAHRHSRAALLDPFIPIRIHAPARRDVLPAHPGGNPGLLQNSPWCIWVRFAKIAKFTARRGTVFRPVQRHALPDFAPWPERSLGVRRSRRAQPSACSFSA